MPNSLKAEAEYHRNQIAKATKTAVEPGTARAILIDMRKLRLAVLEKQLAQGT